MPVYVVNVAKMNPAKFDEWYRRPSGGGDIYQKIGVKHIISLQGITGDQFETISIAEWPDADSYGPAKTAFHAHQDYLTWAMGEYIDDIEIKLMIPFTGE